MTRLATLPFEIGVGTANGQLEVAGSVGVGTPTFALDTTVFSRAPSRGSVKVHVDASSRGNIFHEFTSTLGRAYFLRVRCAVSVLPVADTVILTFADTGGNDLVNIRLTTTGKLQLWNKTAGTQIGSNSAYTVVAGGAAPTADKWFMLGLKCLIGVGSIDVAEGQVNGVTIATASSLALTDTAIGRFAGGFLEINPAVTMDIWYDDGALNDDQTGNENSYPSDAYVALLKPTSDSSATGFTEGAGGTGALWDAVNNTPPVGVVTASATNTSQIKDATNNITDNYVATCESYTTVGVPANATVVLTQAVATVGGSTTVAQSFGLTIASNPTGSEKTGSGPAAAAGTWDSNWNSFYTDPNYAPAPTLGTSPTLKIRQNTASTVTRSVAFMGIAAEVTIPVLPPPPTVVVGAAVQRSATI